MPRSAVLLVAVLFVGPLVATGELGVWVFDAPVSHLVWDEAMEAPGDDGATSPGGGPALAGPAALFVSFVALPLLLALVVWSWARGQAS